MELNPANSGIVPAYTIKRIPDTEVFERRVIKYEKQKDGTMARKEAVEKDRGGYLVVTPRAGTIRARNKAELMAMGLDGRPAMVHLESGEKMPLHVGRLTLDQQLSNLEDASNG